MRDLFDRLDIDMATAFGGFIAVFAGLMLVLVSAFLLPGVGQYYIGDLVQDESYGTVEVNETDSELRITAVGLIGAEEVRVEGVAIDETSAQTRLRSEGESLVIESGSDVLTQSLEPGDTIEIVILVEEDGRLVAAQSRTYEVESEYAAGDGR